MSNIKFCIVKHYIFINTFDRNRAIQNKLQQNFATISVLQKKIRTESGIMELQFVD